MQPQPLVSGLGGFNAASPGSALEIICAELAAENIPYQPLWHNPAVALSARQLLLAQVLSYVDGLYLDVQPYGLRLSPGPSLFQRRIIQERAHARLELSMYASAVQRFKVSVPGITALFTGLHLASGELVLQDPGARADLAQGLNEGIRGYLTDCLNMMPQLAATQSAQPAQPSLGMSVEVHEQLLHEIVHGEVPTASGYRSYRSISETQVLSNTRTLTETIHSLGANSLRCERVHGGHIAEPPVPQALKNAGYDDVVMALTNLDQINARVDGQLQNTAELIESGVRLWLALPNTGEELGKLIQQWWQLVGFGPERFEQLVLLSPGQDRHGLEDTLTLAQQLSG